MKSYAYGVELEQEEDGRWSAVIPALPGCAAWGYTADEAVASVREAARIHVETQLEDGDPGPATA